MHKYLMFIVGFCLSFFMQSQGVPFWACLIFCFFVGFAYHLVFVKEKP